MKKLSVLLLCILMVVGAFVSCAKADPENEEKGAVIPVSIATEIANYDPAFSNVDDATERILGLIYEGLFKYDANGKVVKAQAKSVKILDDKDDDYYAIEIKLKSTAWSDGTSVQAADYIYAWKRILEPEFRGDGASMLMSIKNARAVNRGDVSIDDLGVTDVAANVIKIEFEGPTDYDLFYSYLASPMLVPLREVAVDKVAKDWSSSSSIVVCNGPFCLRSYAPGEKIILERNRYYLRNDEKDSLKKYVTPFRLSMNTAKTAEENLADFEKGALVYDAELPLAKRGENAGKVELTDTASVMSFLFNTQTPPFDDANVRNALSLALDRNEIAKKLTFAKPAAGVIGSSVFNTGTGKKAASFREKGEALIAASANESEAKSLLSKAGVKGGEITITLRDNEADVAVAEYAKSVWEKLGFTVTLDARSFSKYKDEKEYDLVKDSYLEDYDTGNFQIILIDNLMMSTDAFPNLAVFSRNFASAKMDMTSSDTEYTLALPVSGYNGDAFNAKLEEAFAESDSAKRAVLLHEAEALLVADMPIIPLVELQQGTLVGDDCKGLDDAYYGFHLFDDVNLKNASGYPDNEGYEAAAE